MTRATVQNVRIGCYLSKCRTPSKSLGKLKILCLVTTRLIIFLKNRAAVKKG
jgi:hypothetical protein